MEGESEPTPVDTVLMQEQVLLPNPNAHVSEEAFRSPIKVFKNPSEDIPTEDFIHQIPVVNLEWNILDHTKT